MPAEPIYFDNNASTQPLPEAFESGVRRVREGYGNPSSIRGRGANVCLDPCLITAVKRAGRGPQNHAFGIVSTTLEAWMTCGDRQLSDGADG